MLCLRGTYALVEAITKARAVMVLVNFILELMLRPCCTMSD